MLTKPVIAHLNAFKDNLNVGYQTVLDNRSSSGSGKVKCVHGAAQSMPAGHIQPEELAGHDPCGHVYTQDLILPLSQPVKSALLFLFYR